MTRRSVSTIMCSFVSFVVLYEVADNLLANEHLFRNP